MVSLPDSVKTASALKLGGNNWTSSQEQLVPLLALHLTPHLPLTIIIRYPSYIHSFFFYLGHFICRTRCSTNSKNVIFSKNKTKKPNSVSRCFLYSLGSTEKPDMIPLLMVYKESQTSPSLGWEHICHIPTPHTKQCIHNGKLSSKRVCHTIRYSRRKVYCKHQVQKYPSPEVSCPLSALILPWVNLMEVHSWWVQLLYREAWFAGQIPAMSQLRAWPAWSPVQVHVARVKRIKSGKVGRIWLSPPPWNPPTPGPDLHHCCPIVPTWHLLPAFLQPPTYLGQ